MSAKKNIKVNNRPIKINNSEAKSGRARELPLGE